MVESVLKGEGDTNTLLHISHMTSLHFAVVALTLMLASLGMNVNDPTVQKGNYAVPQGDFVSGKTLISSLPQGTLSDKETADILFMREEEKLARDVYLTLGEKWNKPIFINIAASEQTHTEAIKTLIDRYNLTDPIQADRGQFTNPDLEKLYRDLVAEGQSSLEAAYAVGARIEDLDIRDLEEAIAHTDNLDIQTVYENLMRGSRNHLRAFNRQYAALTGENYTPTYMTPEAFTTIIESDTERGGGANSSQRHGMGQTRNQNGNN